MGTVTMQQGTIRHGPGKIFPSRYEGKPPRRSVTVDLPGGQAADCWFPVGSDLEYLQKGDRVFCTPEPTKDGKWQADICLTDELAATLQERRATNPHQASMSTLPPSPAVAAPAPTSTAPPLTFEERWTPERKRQIWQEAEQRATLLAKIYQEIGGHLVDAPEMVRATLATALYEDLAKLW